MLYLAFPKKLVITGGSEMGVRVRREVGVATKRQILGSTRDACGDGTILDGGYTYEYR